MTDTGHKRTSRAGPGDEVDALSCVCPERRCGFRVLVRDEMGLIPLANAHMKEAHRDVWEMKYYFVGEAFDRPGQDWKIEKVRAIVQPDEGQAVLFS